jgi:hypothetical protein
MTVPVVILGLFLDRGSGSSIVLLGEKGCGKPRTAHFHRAG